MLSTISYRYIMHFACPYHPLSLVSPTPVTSVSRCSEGKILSVFHSWMLRSCWITSPEAVECFFCCLNYKFVSSSNCCTLKQFISNLFYLVTCFKNWENLSGFSAVAWHCFQCVSTVILLSRYEAFFIYSINMKL